MKKRLLIIGVLFFAAAFVMAGDIELGIGISPPIGEGDTGEPEQENTFSFHAGYSFWWLFYAAWDGYVMPPGAMAGLTGTTEVDPETGESYFVDGYYRPGFVNMFNVGFRPRIGPLVGLATIGVNQLYIYKQDDPEEGIDYNSEAGANLRLGLGFRSKSHWMIMASAVSIFPSMDELTTTLNDLNSSDPWLQQQAEEKITSSLYPTITLNIWL